MFKIGEVVAYGATGVCTVENICSTALNRAGTKTQECYVLRPVAAPTCLTYVPTANSLLTERMRPVLSADQIHAMLDSIREQPLEWIDDPRQRAEVFGGIAAAGLSAQLLQLIACLYLEKKNRCGDKRRFSAGDDRLLTAAERIVSEEFAYTLKIKPNQVSAYIADYLKQTI